jgi:hypothetical protein
MTTSAELRQVGDATFAQIRARFPDLSMVIDGADPNVDIAVDIPQQVGLSFPLHLNLQSDELHLQAGAFWLEWFPCTKPTIQEAYIEAVTGLLSGTFRIVEVCSGAQVVSAKLQRPDGSGWATIGRTGIGWALPWNRSERVIQNTQVGAKSSRS